VRDDRSQGGRRVLSSPAGDERVLMGWISLPLVPLVADPRGPAVEERVSVGERGRRVAVPILGALVAAGGLGLAWLAAQPDNRLDLARRRAGG
jgi:hypothetical protein